MPVSMGERIKPSLWQVALWSSRFRPSFGNASKASNPGRTGRAGTVRSCLTSFHGTGLWPSRSLGRYLHRHRVCKTANLKPRSSSRRWAVRWCSKGTNRQLSRHSLCPSSVSIGLSLSNVVLIQSCTQDWRPALTPTCAY